MNKVMERDIEAAQLSAIRSIRYPSNKNDDSDDVDVNGEPTFSPSNYKTRQLLYAHHLPRFTREEHTRWSEILNEMRPLPKSLARVIARNRARGARRRWTRFCEFWPILALHLFTERIKRPERPRRRLSPELLARITDSR